MPGRWADRDVRRVVLARFISRVGGEAAVFVGIWGKAAFELEATAGGVAAVMAALGVASLIGSAVAGVLVDRFDPRRVLIVGEILFIPAAIGMVFVETLPSLVVATFILGLVGAPVFTAISAFGPFLTDDSERLARVNGTIEGASWAAFVVGPAMGAIIAGSIGEVGHLLPLAIAPVLAGAFGVRRTLVYAGIAIAISSLFFLPTATRLDRTWVMEVPRTGLADPSDEPRSVGH